MANDFNAPGTRYGTPTVTPPSNNGGVNSQFTQYAPTPTGAPPAAPTASPTATPTTPANGVPAHLAANPGTVAPTSPDAGFSQAQANLAPSAPPSEEDFWNQLYGHFAPVISSINATETAAEQAAYNAGSQGQVDLNASLGSRGLAGSSEAANLNATANLGVAANVAQARQAQASALSDVTKYLATNSHASYLDALSRSDTNSQNYIKQQQGVAENALKGIAAQGIPLSDLKTNNPNEYNGLLQYYSGDENAMAASYIAAIPAPSLINGGNPISVNGNEAVYAYTDPITKTIKTQTITSPYPLSGSYDAKTVPGVGVVTYNKDTGQATVVGGTANPYYMQNQQLTSEQKALGLQRTSQLLESSKALEASRLIGGQIKSDNAIQNFLKVSPMMSRLQAAEGDIQANGINQSNAADLLDSITQINTGGKQITQGQVDLTKESQSYADQATALKQKIDGSGGVIDPKIATQATELSTKIFGLYQKAFQDRAAQYNARLKDVNGQDLSSYSPLTDITQLPSVLDGSYDSSLQAANGSANTTTQVPEQLTSSGFSANPDGTLSDPNGNIYTDNGDGTYSPAE